MKNSNGPAKRLTVVTGEFGMQLPGKLSPIQPLRDPPTQRPALFVPPVRVMRVPTDIHIDFDFQRHVTERGKALIHNMVNEWDWSSFVEPAIYLDKRMGVEVAYDGQHTLIAAATRKDILQIPCDLHDSLESAQAAAQAFANRNWRRVPVSTFQLYKAALVGGMGWALKIQQLAQKLGFKVPTYSSEMDADTIASITTLRRILERRGEHGLETILKPLIGLAIAPIREMHLRAVETLLFDPEYAKLVQTTKLRSVLRGLNNHLIVGEASAEASMRGMTRHQCLANIYLREYQGVHGVR